MLDTEFSLICSLPSRIPLSFALIFLADPFRRGVSVLVSAAPGASTCPIDALTPVPFPSGSTACRISAFLKSRRPSFVTHCFSGFSKPVSSQSEWTLPSILVIVFVEVQHQPLRLSAVLSTRFSSWDIGAVMRTSCILMYLKIVFYIFPLPSSSSGRSPCSAFRASGPSLHLHCGLSSAHFGSVRESLGFQIHVIHPQSPLWAVSALRFYHLSPHLFILPLFTHRAKACPNLHNSMWPVSILYKYIQRRSFNQGTHALMNDTTFVSFAHWSICWQIFIILADETIPLLLDSFIGSPMLILSGLSIVSISQTHSDSRPDATLSKNVDFVRQG